MMCQHVKLPDGTVAIICRDRRQGMTKCHVCRAPATALCDFRLPNGKDCDKPCCAAHSMKQAPEVDYCLVHWGDRWND